MQRIKLAIVGSRDFPYPWIISEYLKRKTFHEIVSGGASGVDTFAQEYAEVYGYPTTIFYADWKKYGKSAGFIRNKQIVEYATDVVAFQYDNSNGTQHTINLAQEAGKLREVISVN